MNHDITLIGMWRPRVSPTRKDELPTIRKGEVPSTTRVGYRRRKAGKGGVCESYALHVTTVTSFVTKEVATDSLGLSATSVNAGPVLITCGVMKALELGADCTGCACVVKNL